MFKVLKLLFAVTFGLLLLAWRLSAWLLSTMAEVDRNAPRAPGWGEYQDWTGAIRPYTYDDKGNLVQHGE